MIIRCITTLILVLGAFIASWWAVALATLVCVFAYRKYVEALIPAAIIDILYGAQPILGIPGFITVATIIVVSAVSLSERYLRGHVRL